MRKDKGGTLVRCGGRHVSVGVRVERGCGDPGRHVGVEIWWQARVGMKARYSSPYYCTHATFLRCCVTFTVSEQNRMDNIEWYYAAYNALGVLQNIKLGFVENGKPGLPRSLQIDFLLRA